ncbi:MAG: UrcA family protein [Pseudomonadota bacterium]
MKPHSTLALLATTALGIAGAATAAPRDSSDPDVLSIRSEAVHYDATQVTDDKSAKELFFRIRKAAEDVCSISSHPAGYEIWFEHNCSENAVEQAVRDANLPALDSYYANLPKALLTGGRTER